MNCRLLALSLTLFATGCASLHNPWVRSDVHETLAQGQRALEGDTRAFARLDTLGERWTCRARDTGLRSLAFWNEAGRERAALMADGVERLAAARSAVVSQRELTELMGNALRDLESEFDAVIEMQTTDGASTEVLMLSANQKYLVRRLQHSLALMAGADLAPAVEAADTFGRDVAEFQRLLDAALNGNEALGIDPPDNPEVEDSLAQIEELFAGYVADSAEDLLENVVYRYDAARSLAEMYAAVSVAPAADAGEAPATDGDAAPDDAAAAEDEAGAYGEDDALDEEAAGDEVPADDDAVDAEPVADEVGADDAGVSEDSAP